MSYEPAAHYDRVTAAWTLLLGEDLHYGVFEAPHEPLANATRRLTELMMQVGEIERGALVLDVGCGIGAPACHIARVVGARVTGITTSHVGVAMARARAEAAGVGSWLHSSVGMAWTTDSRMERSTASGRLSLPT